MASKKGPEWMSAPEEILVAFEAGIRFGRSMEHRHPRRHPLWSEKEWLAALEKAIGIPNKNSA
jgi:hypothetical protein